MLVLEELAMEELAQQGRGMERHAELLRHYQKQ